jgi:hypothetical protein
MRLLMLNSFELALAHFEVCRQSISISYSSIPSYIYSILHSTYPSSYLYADLSLLRPDTLLGLFPWLRIMCLLMKWQVDEMLEHHEVTVARNCQRLQRLHIKMCKSCQRTLYSLTKTTTSITISFKK